jgi:hypothetical protein
MTAAPGPATLKLPRHLQNDFATYGKLYAADGHWLCETIELPFVDADNDGHRDRKKGRIQAGRYWVFLRKSHLHGGDGHRDYDVPQLKDVPDTDNAQIHIACLPRDLEGCIGVGSAFGPVKYSDMKESQPGVQGSENAFRKLMAEVGPLFAKDGGFWLEISDHFDAPKGTFA